MTPVTENDILQVLHEVPQQQWGDVLRYAMSLRNAPTIGNNGGHDRPIRTAADLAQSDLVGLWAARTDLGDSREFARKLRDAAQRR